MAGTLHNCAIRPQRVALKDPDRKSTRLNSSHLGISYAVFCLKKKKTIAHSVQRPDLRAESRERNAAEEIQRRDRIHDRQQRHICIILANVERDLQTMHNSKRS